MEEDNEREVLRCPNMQFATTPRGTYLTFPKELKVNQLIEISSEYQQENLQRIDGNGSYMDLNIPCRTTVGAWIVGQIIRIREVSSCLEVLIETGMVRIFPTPYIRFRILAEPPEIQP